MKPTTNPTPLPPDAILSDRKARAAAWFQDLQGQIIAAFEKAEDDAQGPFFPEATTPGRFEKKTWTRTDHTGAHGGGGTNNDLGLASAYATARLLRLADGPDEVHRNQIAQIEIRRHQGRATPLPASWTGRTGSH